MKNLIQAPLDRAALLIMTGLGLLIAALIALGDHTIPLVKEFSWDQQSIGAEDRAFTMTFNRTMEWDQVSENLSITPPLDGKLSWSGRRLAFTLIEPIEYGQSFKLTLNNVEERQKGSNHIPKTMRPYNSTFRSRPRAFVYVGTNSEEAGRLVLFRLDQGQKTILTPENLEIFDFQPFPRGDRILFSATEVDPDAPGVIDPNLYIVETGMGNNETEQASLPPLKKILSHDDYQILKFDLSPDGERIVLQRAQKSQKGALGTVSLWQVPVNNGKPILIETEAGGDFQIAPDGQTLVIGQGQGLAVIPLDASSSAEPLDYLPEFGTLLSFSLDGTAAAMVKFNTDFTRSLFLVTNQGEQRELVRLKGGILSAQFDAQKKNLYCLLTRVLDDDDYVEQPYLAVVDLNTNQIEPIFDFPFQPNLTMNLAPDADSILFDQVLDSPDVGGEFQEDSQLISSSNLWQLRLHDRTGPLKPERLTSGVTPKWLP